VALAPAVGNLGEFLLVFIVFIIIVITIKQQAAAAAAVQQGRPMAAWPQPVIQLQLAD